MRVGSVFWLGVVVLLALVMAPQLVLPAVGVVMAFWLAGWALLAWGKAQVRGRRWGR